MRKGAPYWRLRLPETLMRPVAIWAVSLLGVCCCGLASASPEAPSPKAENYTSDYEKVPNPTFVERERTAQWAQTEQDRYRLRVALPDSTTSEEDSSVEVQPPSRQREESQTLPYVAVVIFAVVLCI